MSSLTPSPIPTSVRAALANPNWCATMEGEYGALMSNGTWELVTWPCSSNVVTGKWVFMQNLRVDGSFDCYKACWVL
jgi:surface antigen